MSIPIKKTLTEVRETMFAQIHAVQDDYSKKGWLPIKLNLNKGIVRGLIELFAWGLHKLYEFLVLVLKQAFPDSATGPWLVLHSKQISLNKRDEKKSVGFAVFARAGSTGNVMILAGKIIKTKPDGKGDIFRFITTEDTVLPDGATAVFVPIIAEGYGQAYNVTAGQICEFSTNVPGIDTVTNLSGWLTSEGANIEDDDSLRERYRLKWLSNNGCTKYAYMSWALEVAGVDSVRIIDQHPRGQGTVDVIIKSVAGVPTQELIDQVVSVVNANIPINDDVLVTGYTPVNISIDIELELVSGSESEIIEEVQNRLISLFNKNAVYTDVKALEIGEDLPLDRIRGVVMNIVGIKKINFTLPADDTQIDSFEQAVLENLTVTAIWATEE